MRRGRILIFLVLIVIVGVGLLAYVLLQSGGLGGPSGPQPTQQTNLVEIYYAAQNIPQGTVITEEMLGTYSIPAEKSFTVFFQKGQESDLIGKTARINLEQDTPITRSMVGEKLGKSPSPPWAAAQIDTGMVAVSIPTNRLATNAYGVNEGAHVNVIACMLFVDIDPSYQSVLPNHVGILQGPANLPPDAMPGISLGLFTRGGDVYYQGRTEIEGSFQQGIYIIASEPQRPRLVCQMILQDVYVMKLGNFELQQTPSAEPNATPSPAQAQPKPAPDIITLVVNPQDSIALNYFVYSGAMLSMSLRNPNDTSRLATESATLTSMLTQYNISLPSKQPYGMQPRIDQLIPPALPNDVVTVQPQQ